MIDSFKEISIRGRLAYGARCLENALAQYAINEKLLTQLLLPRIWEFTRSEDLSAWEQEINQIDPDVLLDAGAQRSMSTQEATLFQLYHSLPTFITEMISDVIEIGTANLYGGTGSYSVHSLKPLERVIQSCKSHNISLPDLAPFYKTRFEEEHGWGKERDQNFYLQ